MHSSKLTIDDFLAHRVDSSGTTVQSLIDRLKEQLHASRFSDVTDDAGHDYVDLVLQGGGVLGIALVGYVHALEEVGIRFLGLGGSSAGAINALLIAAAGPPADAKAPRLIEALVSMPSEEFLDGRFSARRASRLIADGLAFREWILLLPLLPAIVHTLKSQLGLHPGTRFYQWLTDLLRVNQAETSAKLIAKMRERPQGFRVREEREEGIEGDQFEKRFPGRLAIVTVEARTKTKLVFPEMACLLSDDPDSLPTADFVRASMSIPWFFQPHRMKCSSQNAAALWAKKVDYHGPIPDQLLFVDGGMVSNFPINIFHNVQRVPLSPTFGIRLGADRDRHSDPTLRGYTKAVIDAARQALDYDFLYNNPDYRQLIGTVETDGFNWLDFQLDDHEKLGLFARGVQAAARFLDGDPARGLKGFDWGSYKKLRATLRDANTQAASMNPRRTGSQR